MASRTECKRNRSTRKFFLVLVATLHRSFYAGIPQQGLNPASASDNEVSSSDQSSSQSLKRKDETRRLRRGLNSLPQLAAMYEAYEKEENSFLLETKTSDRTEEVADKSENNEHEPTPEVQIVEEQVVEEQVQEKEEVKEDTKETENEFVKIDPSALSPPSEPRRRKSSLYKTPSLVVVPSLPKSPTLKPESSFYPSSPEPSPVKKKMSMLSFTNKSLQDVSNFDKTSKQSSSLRDLSKSSTKRIATPKTAMKNLINKLAPPKKKQEKSITPRNAGRQTSNIKTPLKATLSLSSAGESTDVEINETLSSNRKIASPTPSASTSRSVSPARSNSPKKGSSSPSRPASRSSGIITPGTNTKSKTTDKKSNKSQPTTSKILGKKAPPILASDVGKEVKTKVTPKKVVAPKTSKSKKTLNINEKQQATSTKFSSVQKVVSKNNLSNKIENKTESTLKATMNSDSKPSNNRSNNNNIASKDRMKETNLNDDETMKTKSTPREPIDQHTERDSAPAAQTPHNTVQMNRAARLRLLKKIQSPSNKMGLG